MTARTAASGWARAVAITVALGLAALFMSLAFDWQADRLSLLIWVWATLQGVNLAFSAQPGSLWIEVGRGVFVSGILAITVWAVDRLQRDFEAEQTARQQAFEERESLRLTIGLRDDLTGIDLRDADLSGFQLAGKDLSGADLSGSDLSGANLSDSVVVDASLAGSDLAGADLSGTDLSDSDLSDADLSGATMVSTVLTDANLARARIVGADLEGADLPGACLAESDLSDARLPGADLTSAVLTAATLDRAVLESDLRPAVLTGAGFAGASATETTWPGDRAPANRIDPDPSAFEVADLPAPDGTEPDTVVAVADGDTVELEQGGAARLIGVDAPDIGDPGGEEAKAYAEERLTGAELEVIGGTDGVDAFGRKLVYIWLPDGSSFNQGLLETGNATLLPSDEFATEAFAAAEGRAKQLGAGYWARCPTAG